MKAISFDKLVEIYDVSKRIECRDAFDKELRNSIESNKQLTTKEKIILEMWLGLWNNKVYTEETLCELYELTHDDIIKIKNKATRRKDDRFLWWRRQYVY